MITPPAYIDSAGGVFIERWQVWMKAGQVGPSRQFQLELTTRISRGNRVDVDLIGGYIASIGVIWPHY